MLGENITSGKIFRFMDNSPTNQLTDKPTRRQTNSPTNQLADKPTCRQTNSPTNQLTDKPTCRQTNSLLVRTCWPYTDRSADHLCSPATYDNLQYCWSTAAASGTPAEDMAVKAGWICSAGSSGSASSLRSIRCVRVLSRCTPSPDLLSNRSSTAWLASITIITVQLLTDAGLLQVHAVNVVAPYTDIYTKKCRQISSTSLPERHVRVPKQSYIDFGDNFNFGELACWRVWLSASWFVSDLDCRRVGLSASWFVGELSSYQNINPLGILKQQDVMKVALVITETML